LRPTKAARLSEKVERFEVKPMQCIRLSTPLPESTFKWLAACYYQDEVPGFAGEKSKKASGSVLTPQDWAGT
jgi:hypothetical protein